MYAVYFIARRLRQVPQKAFTSIVYKIGIVSVALGLATTLIAFLTMQGFQRKVMQKLTGFSGHIGLTTYALSQNHASAAIDQRQLPKCISSNPAVRTIKACAYKLVLLKANEEVEGVLCKGLDPTAVHKNLCPYITAGRLLDLQKPGYGREIMLSTLTAAKLQVNVGDELLACVLQQPPRYRKLRVVGIYTTQIEDIDKKLALCDLRLIQRLNNWPNYGIGAYEIGLHDWQQARTVAQKLLEQLDYRWTISTIDREYAAVFDWLMIIHKNALVFMVMILIVVGTNLASIVLVQMIERTAMIGTLRALGASNGQIQHIMLVKNLSMVMRGMAWGNGIGLGLCALQSYYKLLKLNPTYYYLDYVPIAWDWPLIIMLNGLVLGVVLVVMVVAVAITVRSRPIQAMQFR